MVRFSHYFRKSGVSKISKFSRISRKWTFLKRYLSQSLDLPLPHGLAPSETMVWDHGLNHPLSTENPRNKGFSGYGAPICGFGLADPKGVGVDPCLLNLFQTQLVSMGRSENPQLPRFHLGWPELQHVGDSSLPLLVLTRRGRSAGEKQYW